MRCAGVEYLLPVIGGLNVVGVEEAVEAGLLENIADHFYQSRRIIQRRVGMPGIADKYSYPLFKIGSREVVRDPLSYRLGHLREE